MAEKLVSSRGVLVKRLRYEPAAANSTLPLATDENSSSKKLRKTR